MFILSQIALHKSGISSNSVPSYSVATGLLIYAVIYMYILYYHSEYASMFNKFVIYIIGIDLLLSAFYNFKFVDTSHKQSKVIPPKPEQQNESESDLSSFSDSESDTESALENEQEITEYVHNLQTHLDQTHTEPEQELDGDYSASREPVQEERELFDGLDENKPVVLTPPDLDQAMAVVTLEESEPKMDMDNTPPTPPPVKKRVRRRKETLTESGARPLKKEVENDFVAALN